ncbi:MAG: phytoene desaturase family protein [Acidimicrobiales bacterium]
MSDAEVIVVGGGHNGLICAAYLARAGVDTLLLEARTDVGGCASTVADLGARFNICHCDHTMIRALPIVDELDLGHHGLEYLEPSAAAIYAFHDRSDPWVLFHDPDRTVDALAASHPGQVAAYRRYLADALPVAELVLDLVRTRPTGPRLVASVLRRRAAGANRLWGWGRRSAAEVLGRYFDDWHLVMPAVSTGPTVWGLPADTPGTGLAALSYATRHLVRGGRPRGGSGLLTDATRASFEAAGGVVRCGATVTSLVVDDGAVRGVRLDDGTEMRAATVVAACDPQRVLVDWIDEPPAAARALVERWRQTPVRQGYESKVDAVVTGAPARLAGLDAVEARLGGIDLSEPTTFVSPSPTEVAEAHRLRPEGRVADRPTLLVNSPSALDPTMRPGLDRHVVSLEALFTPYSLTGGWPGSGEPARWLSVWGELAEPGFEASIERWRVMTPDRYEREFAMHRGHTPSYGGSPLATLVGRRPELSRYRTPIDGLHLTGAGTFPGAGIFGASGRNAAAVVIERVRGSSRRRWSGGR